MNALSFLEVALICRAERRKTEEMVSILTLLFRRRTGVQGLGIYLPLQLGVQTMCYLGLALVCKWQKIQEDSGSAKLGVAILLPSRETRAPSTTPQDWPLLSRSQCRPEHSRQQDKRQGLRRKGHRAYTFLLRKQPRNYHRLQTLVGRMATRKLWRRLGKCSLYPG